MTKATYYSPDDLKSNFKRNSKKVKPTKLNPKIQPGNVLILLTGRFKGRRVVFLKQLKSGLLLVTGPYKINGVPLKRVNQAYVIPTSTKVDVSKVKSDSINDEYFTKSKVKKSGVGKNTIFESRNELSAEEALKVAAKKKNQIEFDRVILESIKKTELMSAYLKSRFTIRKNTQVQELKF